MFAWLKVKKSISNISHLLILANKNIFLKKQGCRSLFSTSKLIKTICNVCKVESFYREMIFWPDLFSGSGFYSIYPEPFQRAFNPLSNGLTSFGFCSNQIPNQLLDLDFWLSIYTRYKFLFKYFDQFLLHYDSCPI